MYVLLAAVLLFANPNQTNPNTSSNKASVNERATEQKTRDSQKTPSQADSSGGCVNCLNVQAPHTEEKQADPYDASKDALYRAYLAFTIIGVCGGLIGLTFLIIQTLAAKKAANAAKETADAALLNAKAIINAERPWMFIEFKTAAHGAVRVGDVPHHVSVSVTFRNRGKTPAEIVGFAEHTDCRQNTSDLPSVPEYSQEGEVLVHTRMIPPGETWSPPMSYFSPGDIFTSEQWRDIRGSSRRLIYWGRLQYRDLIEESKTIHELKKDKPITIHETCFCYFWSPPLNEFLITGPLGYNKHT